MLHTQAILQKVARYISRYEMFGNDPYVLVALSGGSDSVALFYILRALHYPLEVAHCNFQLRGEESERDERFVTDLCQRFHVPCHVKRFNTRDYAAANHLSIEMAARELRYIWFETLREETGCTCVAVAHHIEDQAETILLNLIRGTGLRGLVGMHPVRAKIVRPLLCLRKQEILDFLAINDISFVTDSTNMERDALRNRIRLDVIPLLQELNPQIINALTRMSENIYPLLDIILLHITSLFKRFDINPFHFQPQDVYPTTLLPLLIHEWVRGKGFNRIQEQEMISTSEDAYPGQCWKSRKEYVVIRTKWGLQMTKFVRPPEHLEIIQEIVPEVPSGREPQYAYFDADELIYPLRVRLIKPTDKMVPFGKRKPRSINRILKKAGIRNHERASQWVLCHGSEVLWIVNVRASNLHRVTENTVNILRVRVPGIFRDDGLGIRD